MSIFIAMFIFHLIVSTSLTMRVFTCRILVRTSFTSTRTLLTLPRISERLHEPGELSISSASMKSRLQIRIIKSYNIEIYSFVQNSLWTYAICAESVLGSFESVRRLTRYWRATCKPHIFDISIKNNLVRR